MDAALPATFLNLDGSPAPKCHSIAPRARGKRIVAGQWVGLRNEVCPKCGGAGSLAHYSHVDSGVCYECDGTTTVEVKIDLYDETGRLAEIARREKRAAREQAKREREAAALRAEVAAQHAAAGEALVAFCAALDASSDFLATLRRWGLGETKITEKQIAAARKVFEREAAKAQSAHLDAKPGDRLDLEVTFERMAAWTERYGYQEKTVYVFALRTAEGHAIVCKTSATPFYVDLPITCETPSGERWESREQRWAQPGERFRIRATVKALTDYKGEKQTQVERVRATLLNPTTTRTYPDREPAAAEADPFAGL